MQATNRAVFVPLAPQGRYTGLGGTNPQRFIPQPLASEPVHAESTIHSEPACPVASDDSPASMRTPFVANGIMTGQFTQASAVNSTQGGCDRTFRRKKASALSLRYNTCGERPPGDASSRLLARRGGASGMMPQAGAAVCPMVVIDAAGDSMPAQDASQMSMLDCIAPRATEAAAALRLNQLQAHQDRQQAEAGQLESKEGLFDEEEQQAEAEVQQLAVAVEQVMEGQAAGGAPEAVEGNAGVGQAAAEEGNATEEEGGFSAAEKLSREGAAKEAQAWAASQAAHAAADEEEQVAGAIQSLASVSGVQWQTASSTLDGTLTMQVRKFMAFACLHLTCQIALSVQRH